MLQGFPAGYPWSGKQGKVGLFGWMGPREESLAQYQKRMAPIRAEEAARARARKIRYDDEDWRDWRNVKREWYERHVKQWYV